MTAKKKAAPKAEPKPKAKPPKPPAPEAAGLTHVAAALPASVSDSMRGWRVKHHMTKYHDRPQEENPFLKLRPDGTCSFCGGQL